MPRIKFKKSNQIKFLEDLRIKSKINNLAKLAKILGVYRRNLSNWSREEYTLPEEVFKKCIKLARGKVKIPSYKVLPDFWSTRKAGKKGAAISLEKHGNPGTLEGRKKGGLISQRKRKLHPEFYQHCNLRKIILKPKNTVELAELFGIILGDGGISSTQVDITLNKHDAKEYSCFVCGLFKKLFKLNPSIYESNHGNFIDIVVSSTNFVEFLLFKGLRKGNKVKHQVGVPSWIRNNKEFSRRCLRGLIDTDGCVYSHTHASGGHNYFNFGLNFSNRSFSLLAFVRDTLISLGFNAKLSKKGVNLYRESEVCRYAQEISFSNPYHAGRLERFLKIKQRRGVPNGKALAWKVSGRKPLQVRVLSPPPCRNIIGTDPI